MFLKGVWFGTLYKMQGRTISDGCNSSIVLDIGVEEEITPTVSRLPTIYKVCTNNVSTTHQL